MKKVFLVYRTYNNKFQTHKEVVRVFSNQQAAVNHSKKLQQYFYYLVGELSNKYPELTSHDIIEKHITGSEALYKFDKGLPATEPPLDLVYTVEEQDYYHT